MKHVPMAMPPGMVAPTHPVPTQRTLELIPPEQTFAYRALRRTVVMGGGAALALLLGAGLLLLNTVITGAVVTNGVLVVQQGSQKVQQPTGGVVAKLLVHEDDVVEAGQTLLLLDDTVNRARLDTVGMSLTEQQVRLTRLLAERDGLEDLFFPTFDPSMPVSALEYAGIISDERQQFSDRRENRNGQRAQLNQRIAQTTEAINAADMQLTATRDQKTLVDVDISNLQGLVAKQLAGSQRLSELQQTRAQLVGQEGSLRAGIAENRARIAELAQMVAQVDLSLRAELVDQISAAQGQIADLSGQLVIAKDALRRSIVTAPLAGVIHELNVHTVGGVVQPGETLMLIVPRSDELVGEVKISPADIDQVYPGQTVSMHFSAFDRGTTPALAGHLSSVSPDLVTDQRGASYYVGRAEPDEAELARLPGGLKLVPGMPVEVFIKTDQRTILSYLVKPLSDQLERAFR